ncbi:MAG TPA: hypothetical protein VIW68_11695, partial [Candidatus Sulfotelmatobacter sp.]
MSRQKAVTILILFALVAAVAAAFVFLPKHYSVGQSVSQTVVFWNDQDAFLFLDGTTIGRSRNTLQDMLARGRYGFLGILVGVRYADFSKPDVVAYHLAASGQLDRFALPEHTATYGSWGLVDGRLQLMPAAGGSYVGTRWDGET